MAVRPKAEFLQTPGAQLFTLHYRPSGALPDESILLLPPLTEEMNKCRRLLTLAGQELTRNRCEFMVVDLRGTGDSSGDFSEARWDDWHADIHTGIKAMERPPSVLLAVRAGALLLDRILNELAPLSLRVVLVQPVIHGYQYLEQLLRVRVMASRFAGGRESLAELKTRQAAGEILDRSGYCFHPELAEKIGSAQLAPPTLARASQVDLLELQTAAPKGPRDDYETLAAQGRLAGGAISTHLVTAEPFWSTLEIATPRAALAAIVARCASN